MVLELAYGGGTKPSPAASLVASHAEFGSDIVPRFADWQVFMQRASMLLFAGGFLAFAADAHPRRDDGSPVRRIGLGVVLVVLGVLGVGSVAMGGVGDLHQRDKWLAVHESLETNALADVERIRDSVRIDPGCSTCGSFPLPWIVRECA